MICLPKADNAEILAEIQCSWLKTITDDETLWVFGDTYISTNIHTHTHTYTLIWKQCCFLSILQLPESFFPKKAKFFCLTLS